MGLFFPNQRWTSEGEPELGIGIVKETNKATVKIFFPVSGETRLYARESAPLRRLFFMPGDAIQDNSKQTMIIDRVEEDGHLFIYHGEGRIISEADLGDVAVKHFLNERLLNGDIDSPGLFSLRRHTLQLDYRRRISPVNGYVGGRIDLIPHQLYIAHEVSSRYAPRVLLSDQVGLGKTIEACLILHRLLLNGRISRALILVPDSLVHQWFVELLRRFSLWFHIFDEERCVSLDDNAPEGNPFLDNQLIICSVDFLANSEKRASQALSAKWDMMVVDEAHHLEWSVDEVSPAYAVVELLSKVAKGLLLLTASPEQLGADSHFARLRLLDPVRYASLEAFNNESSDHKEIANIVDALSEGKRLNSEQTKMLEALFDKERIASLLQENLDVRNKIVEDLLDQHGPGRVVFRNTRSAMSGFPKRKVHLAPIKLSGDFEIWIKRFTNEFLSETEANGISERKKQFWFAKDPRLDWLVKKMKELQHEKILLICRNKEKTLALEETLKKRANFRLSVFHEDLTIVQRDRNAAWFSESNGARMLICSEIGSEGRNFQFVHHLILFDLPLHPELLEQRIGRLDRIGQKKDIHIHVPYIVDSPQEGLVRWYHEGLNAFEENIEAGNKIAELFSIRLQKICLNTSFSERTEQLSSLIKDTTMFQEELKNILAKGRDRLLEMNSFRPKIANELIENIREVDQDSSLEMFLLRVFEHFGIEIEDLAPRTYLLHSTPANAELFPAIPKIGVAVSFDRLHALSREEILFITWDHPMLAAAIDLVLSSGTGAVSYGIFREAESPGLLVELIFVLETGGKHSNYADRFLLNTPIRIVVDHSGNEMTEKYPVDILNKKLKPGISDDLSNNLAIMETILPKMIRAATDIAEDQAAIEILKGIEKMNFTLDHEINRLISLNKKNKEIRPDEIDIAVEEKLMLTKQIKEARLRLDAIQLIQKGDF